MKSWSFDSREVADKFDKHVREQLPWYDMITDAVVYITRNYLTEGNRVVDIGASTGNLSRKLLPLAEERKGRVLAIEKSLSMICKMDDMEDVGVMHADINDIDIPEAQVYILFLTMMFIPVDKRADLINKLSEKIKSGGCIIIVDKINHAGYFGTVMKRLTWHWKIQQGAQAEDIVNKEMSLAGVQIPIDEEMLDDAKEFFRMGEFAGWVIEF
jgi:tRNA (cmo5U34)-methyltransferase